MSALQWLVLVSVMTAFLWVPYVLNRFFALGIFGSMKALGPDELKQQAPWALRAQKAHSNAIENLVVFAPLMLAAHAVDMGNASAISTAGLIYFSARVVHYLSYTLNISGVRTVAFLAGLGAQILIAVTIWGAL